MSFQWLAIVLMLAGVCRLAGQVSVDVVFEQEQFLRDESLRLKVRITNLSGQTLHLGEGNDWLTFVIQSRDGGPVRKLGEVPVQGAFDAESATVVSRSIDLMPYYDFSQPGRYTVSATIKIKQWDREVISKPRDFDIVRGTKIWEQDFGVPAASGEPEVRKYALQLAPFFKERKLYLRLTDLSETRIFRAFPLGPTVSFGQPETQLDKTSNLHVLFQTGARSFSYNVVSPNGEVLVRQAYAYGYNRPTLKAGKDGRILVSGGVRQPAPSDIPSSAVTNDVREPKS
jgi:hypothetical protein